MEKLEFADRVIACEKKLFRVAHLTLGGYVLQPQEGSEIPGLSQPDRLAQCPILKCGLTVAYIFVHQSVDDPNARSSRAA